MDLISLKCQLKILKKAAIIASAEVFRQGFLGMYNDAWDARIIGPDNKIYEILRNGEWLVDFETGEIKESDLEKIALKTKESA